MAFQLTGGPTSQAGLMADAGGVNDFFNTFRKKSSGINQLPGLGLELGAKKHAADQYAETMDTRAYWDAKTIGAQADARAGEIRDQGSKAKTGGLIKGGLSLAMAALPLFSDKRVKHTVEELDNALSLLRGLRPVTFYYNEGFGSESSRMHYGFIAQEFSEHFPDATYLDEDTKMLAINPSELIGVLVKANQELEQRIVRLEAKAALAGVAQ